jgi:tryptophan halogenase
LSAAWPRIVIAGGGTAGWSAAAAMARALGRGHGSVRVLADEADDSEELAFAALPSARDFHRFLGLDEDRLMRASRGAFRLGARLAGWAGDGSAWFQPFGTTGAMLQQVGFHHHLLRLEGLGRRREPEDFSLAAMAARAGRFARPSADPRSVLSTLDYGLHLEAKGYRDVLRALAEGLGVRSVQGSIAAVEPEGSATTAVITDAGERIEGDVFIDATGARARLIGQALGVPLQDWSGLAPFDRRLELLAASSGPPAPNTEILATTQGPVRRAPLQGRVGLSLVYSSAAMSDEAALAFLRSQSQGPAIGEPRFAALGFGRRERAWSGNCIAVGAAAGQADPLGIASLHLLHAALLRLVALFPPRGEAPASAAEYNRLIASETDRLGDFVLAHFKTNRRVGEPAWDRCREAPASEALAHKIGLYESRARTPMRELETFPEEAWSALFRAQGLRPRRHDPFAEAMDVGQLETTLQRMHRTMADAVSAMPSHGDFIAANCRVPALEDRA